MFLFQDLYLKKKKKLKTKLFIEFLLNTCKQKINLKIGNEYNTYMM